MQPGRKEKEKKHKKTSLDYPRREEGIDLDKRRISTEGVADGEEEEQEEGQDEEKRQQKQFSPDRIRKGKRIYLKHRDFGGFRY